LGSAQVINKLETYVGCILVLAASWRTSSVSVKPSPHKLSSNTWTTREIPRQRPAMLPAA
jgi:hypothetical protein